jgi:hypothetical protein
MGPVEIARGVRAAEAELLGAVARLAAEARGDPALLARPVRIVVPARSLREHLLVRLAREERGVAGVAVQTLHGLAHEILRRCGQPRRAGGELLFPVVVRQEARREPLLHEALEPLRDGYGVVAASVSDLLDAGLDESCAEALDERLAALGGAAAERARAVVRVAVRALAVLQKAGVEHRADFFRRARAALEADPEAALPSRAVLVHGYADATGVQADLLLALVRCAGARVIVDWPDNPAEPGSPDPGVRFTERLIENLGGVASRAAAEPPPAATPELLRAPGAYAEARAVAERVRRLLDAGSEPERIGIVARSLDPYLAPLRVQLRRLGIPFSGAPGGGGPLAPEGRRLRALLDLLAAGPEAPADRWLDACDVFPPGLRADLRVALHALGVARLAEAVRLDPGEVLAGKDRLPLPVRRGLVTLTGESGAAGDGEGAEAAADEAADDDRAAALPVTVVAARRSVTREQLTALQAQGGSVVDRLGRLAGATTLGEHLGLLDALVRQDLGWAEHHPARETLTSCLERLGGELPAGFALSFEDLVLLLGRALRGAGCDALGGKGAGVVVLSVVEARARSFEHLFLLGMNRDLFPRGVTEDPLLPDEVRRALEEVLADIPLKRRGFDEERYLFAQLCSSAPHVTASWQAVTDEGKDRSVSPLIERIRLGLVERGRVVEAPALAPGLWSLPRPGAAQATPPPARPACEHAVLAGFERARRGGGERFREVLALALGEGPRLLGLEAAADAAELAAARARILEELEPPEPGRPPGPYFGFVGAALRPDDPRGSEVHVTSLESLAWCGWRAFLEKLLRLEPVPDALSDLPGVEKRLVGSVLHGVLEKIAQEAGVPANASLAELQAAAPCDVPWPDAARFEAILEEAARETARAEGVAVPGFGRILAAQARRAVERARRLEFGPEGVLRGVLGAEVEGEIDLRAADGRALRLRFRADRVDGGPPGLRLTDYKSGKPPSDAKGEATRREHALRRVARGLLLQGAAYARAADVGRYVFAKPDLEEGAARLEIDGGDAELQRHFDAALRTLLEARQAGSFGPRLVDAKGETAPACQWCRVSEACLRGDSDARRRLRAWREASRDADLARMGPAERALLELLRLDEAGPPTRSQRRGKA